MKASAPRSTTADRVVPLTSISLLTVAWFVALIGAALLAISFHGKSEFFYGIASTREQVISFQYPVEIVQIHAVEGKGVAQGQPILEVRRHDLAAGQDTLDERIRRFDLEKKESTNTLGSQVTNLVAKRAATLADLDGQIHAVERKLRALQSVMGTEQRPGAPAAVDSIELGDLKQKRRFTDQATTAEINNLKSQLGGLSRPIDAQIAELQKTKTETQRQAQALKVGALFDGRVSSINFRQGELVPAYQPILTVHGLAPRDVKAYVHENVLNDVKLGQTVWVRPVVSQHAAVALEATVEGLGNRIVEYPLRLRRNQAVTAYGREVVVKLKADSNPLLFGEKVEVALSAKRDWPNLLSSAQAKILGPVASDKVADNMVQVLASQDPSIQANTIEASGLWWNAKEGHYLLVSDESYGQGAAIFTVSPDLKVLQRLKMARDTNIDDLESISGDGDNVYVLSSLSVNKQGEQKNKRRKLMRLRYQGHQVSAQEEIDLHEVLLRLSQAQPTTALTTFLSIALKENSLNIEAHFVRDGKLYLGFKSPASAQQNTLIAEIDNLAALFARPVTTPNVGAKVSAKVWADIALIDPVSGQSAKLSDMAWVGQQLYLLSVASGASKSSQMWRWTNGGPKPTLLKRFNGLAAEGLAYRPDNATLTVVFDEGKGAASKVQTLPLSALAPAAHTP
jgi:multidrug resistance efflux pump